MRRIYLLGPAAIVTILFRLPLLPHPGTRPWTLHDLHPPGACYSHATAINDEGQVVGWWRAPEGAIRAFLWTPDVPNGVTGTFSDLGLSESSHATGINATGQVVGWMYDAPHSPRAFLWSPFLPNGPEGILTELQVPGTPSIASAINDEGQVVGYYAASSRVDRGFLWTPDVPNGRTGTWLRVGTARERSVYPAAINKRGQIVGRAGTAEGKAQGFLWTPEVPNGDRGTFTYLLPLGSRNSEATAINDRGEVTGCMRSPDGTQHAYLGAPVGRGIAGSFVDLHARSCYSSRGNGINAHGQVVGWSDSLRAETCCTLFGSARQDPAPPHPGSLRELSSRGSMMSEGSAINKAGQVVGTWRDAAGDDHAALWQSPR